MNKDKKNWKDLRLDVPLVFCTMPGAAAPGAVTPEPPATTSDAGGGGGEVAAPFFLSTACVGGRNVAYAVAGKDDANPVLVFYPMGGSRRIVELFLAPASRTNARLICVNRPGMGGTTSAAAGVLVKTACDDALAVLDHLGVKEVGILALCAGTPFALAFSTLAPERVRKHIVGCSAWVSPRDCSEAKLLYRIGAHLPPSFVSAAGGLLIDCVRSAPGLIPLTSMTSMTAMTSLTSVAGSEISGVTGEEASLVGTGDLGAMPEGPEPCPCVTDEEAALFCIDRTGAVAEAASRARVARFLQQPNQGESGGEGEECAVLADGMDTWGIDFAELQKHFAVTLFHGEEDTTVPLACAVWFLDRLPRSSVLHRVARRTHVDVMLLGIEVALTTLLAKPSERA